YDRYYEGRSSDSYRTRLTTGEGRMRVVSICPSNTEVVAYLGKTDLLVGVDDYSDWPASVLELPKLGPDLSIDMDKVAALKPDIVLASLSDPGMEKNIAALEEKQLPYIILNPNALEVIAEDIREVGKALNLEALGNEKAEVFLREVESFRKQAAIKTERPTVYWEWWASLICNPGGVICLDVMSYLEGAENIVADIDVESVQIDLEDVKTGNPDHICMVWVGLKEEKMNADLVIKRPGCIDMKAIQQG